MSVVEYRFRASSEAPAPSTDWMRQLGVAIATAAWVLPEDTVEIFVGTVTHPTLRSAELVAFRLACDGAQLIDALQAAGASRFLATTARDELDPRVTPFGFLHQATLVRPFWHGPASEAELRNATGLTTVCSRDESDDELLRAAFGAPDLVERVSTFVGPAQSLAAPPRTSLARSTCLRPSRQ